MVRGAGGGSDKVSLVDDQGDPVVVVSRRREAGDDVGEDVDNIDDPDGLFGKGGVMELVVDINVEVDREASRFNVAGGEQGGSRSNG